MKYEIKYYLGNWRYYQHDGDFIYKLIWNIMHIGGFVIYFFKDMREMVNEDKYAAFLLIAIIVCIDVLVAGYIIYYNSVNYQYLVMGVIFGVCMAIMTRR